MLTILSLYLFQTNHFLLVVTESGIQVWEYLFTTKAGEGWVGGTAGITGVLLFIIFGIMAFMSLPFVRRSGHFEVSEFGISDNIVGTLHRFLEYFKNSALGAKLHRVALNVYL